MPDDRYLHTPMSMHRESLLFLFAWVVDLGWKPSGSAFVVLWPLALHYRHRRMSGRSSSLQDRHKDDKNALRVLLGLLGSGPLASWSDSQAKLSSRAISDCFHHNRAKAIPFQGLSRETVRRVVRQTGMREPHLHPG